MKNMATERNLLSGNFNHIFSSVKPDKNFVRKMTRNKKQMLYLFLSEAIFYKGKNRIHKIDHLSSHKVRDHLNC